MAATNTEVDVKMLGFLCIVTVILAFIARVYWVLVRRRGLKKEKVEKLVKTMIVMGSGLTFSHVVYRLTGFIGAFLTLISTLGKTPP